MHFDTASNDMQWMDAILKEMKRVLPAFEEAACSIEGTLRLDRE